MREACAWQVATETSTIALRRVKRNVNTLHMHPHPAVGKRVPNTCGYSSADLEESMFNVGFPEQHHTLHSKESDAQRRNFRRSSAEFLQSCCRGKCEALVLNCTSSQVFCPRAGVSTCETHCFPLVRKVLQI